MIVNEAPAVLRIGHVLEFNPETLRARVHFPDINIDSYWLPVIVSNTLNTKDSCFLDEGEHVLCFMQGNGTESGFIIGAFYDDKNPPAVQDKDKRTVIFDDDTSITYDRNSHTMTIDCSGEIIINAANHIALKAARIDLN